MFRNSKRERGEAKALEVMEACGLTNVVVEIDGEVLGGEMVPALIAAGVTVGSKLHTSAEYVELSAEEIVGIVVKTAVCMEDMLYDGRHRKEYGEAKAKAVKAFRRGEAARDEHDEDLDELDRILAQMSLDDVPDIEEPEEK